MLDAQQNSTSLERVFSIARGFAVGRWLRTIAGVEEKIFSTYFGETARYTSLGGVVIGTATLAGVSMAIAISQIFDGFSLWYLVPAITWGLFILNFDRWLVSSTSLTGLRGPLTYIPRALLATVLGAIIAVPFTLKIFETAIVREVVIGREKLVEREEALWTECNPEFGVLVTLDDPAICDSYKINVALRSPTGTAAERDAIAGELSALRFTLAEDQEAIRELEEQLVAECAGQSGDGLSGVEGEGPRCRRNQELLDQQRSERKVEDTKEKVADLEERLVDLETTIGGSTDDWNQALTSAIQTRVAELRSAVDDMDTIEPFDAPIGFTERLEGLFIQGEENRLLTISHLAVALFFILIDIAPILVKVISGRSTYDKLVTSNLEATLLDAAEERTAELEASRMRRSVKLAAVRAETQSKMDDLTRGMRQRQERDDAEKRQKIVDLRNNMLNGDTQDVTKEWSL